MDLVPWLLLDEAAIGYAAGTFCPDEVMARHEIADIKRYRRAADIKSPAYHS